MKQTVTQPFLQGEGEMAELIRNYDWSANAVGSIHEWPLSLRTLVHMMLTSKFPMLIFWGKELITFYNDAFRPSLGNDGKHPSSLGQRGEQSWAESWPVIGPMIYNIMKGGDAVWFEDQKLPIYREGAMGYAYWTYSFSPLTGDDGSICGVLVTCTETTSSVENLYHLAEAKEQQEMAIEAAELGIWDLNPVTGKFTSNSRLKEWFGLKEDEDIELPLALNMIDEADRERVSNAISRSMQPGSDGVYEEEYVIINPHTGKRTTVQAKGKVKFNEAGQSIRLNGTLRDITQQVTALKKLEESETLFRSLVEEAPFAISLYKGKHFVIDIANDAMIKLWGKTPAVVGQQLIVALPELEGQPFIGLLQNVMETGIPYSTKEQMAQLVVDGILQDFWFNFTYKPLFDAYGNVYGILNMATDVTGQVKNRREAEESNLFARSIIDNSPVAKIVFTGKNMVIDIVNQNMLEMLGRDDSIIGKPFLEAMPELQTTTLLQRLQHVYTTGETYTQPEERIDLIRYGKPYTGYYNYIYKALRNTAGEIYGIIVTGTEITEQVLVRKKVEEAELKLLAAIEVAALATWSVDVASGRITYSQKLQEWLGVEEGVMEPGGSSRIIEQDRQRIRNAIERALQTGSAGEMDETYTVINQQSGQKRIIHVNGKTLFDTDGKAVSLSGTAQDVTVQQELQLALENEVQTRTEELAGAFDKLKVINQELEEANNQLLQSNEQLAQYAYVASHDLQEPLRKIQLYSGLLTDDEEISSSTYGTIRKIQDSASRMSLLIRDLLDFSRLLKSDSLYQPVDLNKVVSSVLNDYELLISETNAVIKIESLPTINAIEFQMRQLFYNLIGNALKFLIPGKVPSISVSCKKIKGEPASQLPGNVDVLNRYHIIITDNGIGFSQIHADQIFEIFKRLHGRDQYSGTGIGLALCKKIVENHHGKIYAESNPEQGANFHIILPEQV